MSFADSLVTEKELLGVKKRRSQPFVFEKFEYELQEKRTSEGWIVDKELKSLVRMKKLKPIDERFEDEVWCLFANLGFSYMNRDRNFKITYGTPGSGTEKQIDVFASDEETVLLIECKCAVSGKKGDFKTDLEAIKGIKEGLYKTIRSQRTFKGKKFKYIFATKNYEIIDADKKRMQDLGIYHLDEYGIKYFAELAKHLGGSARYQLLGTLFAGQKIGAIENRIPAIEGKMGGYTYYSFSIEPDRLLKIAYVLHRNEANSDMMPTYQRIIKRTRLKEIRKFIDKGGFFPNSLIISLDTNGKKLQFDQATPQVDTAISRIGILHLPQLYRSAYIIDGQHRLYGYAESKYASSNSIPVVAFVNLDKDKQVELFMEINENQRSVSKNLQNTLNADLLWSSEDKSKQRKALRLNIAQRLGELQSSPFFGRIVIGENESSQYCNLTIDTIENALKSTHFMTRFGKDNNEVEAGTFDRGNNEATRQILLPFLIECFQYFKTELPEEWERGDTESGVLTINNTIHALIRIINDIVDYLVQNNKLNPKTCETHALVEMAEPFFAPIICYLGNITEEQRREIRTNYGSGGKTRVWRLFESIINKECSDFSPEGLKEWIRDNTKQFNAESFNLIRDIEYIIKTDFKKRLQAKYNEKWLTAGMPPKVYKQANASKANQDYQNSINGIIKDVTIWDCVTVANCKDIAVFGANWTELFEKDYTRPEDMKISGGKAAKTAWISKFASISNNSGNANYSFSEDEYLFLKSIYDWLNNRQLS